ncbi:GNAT family N-acetyltransferase [Nakamurella lactea]|uniref:GNAT family N-acetyltransferase n=1 Tax=Nakamurella lactea TaxID=459515 RepID=UPI0004151967|nr:GNAT family N-acetyltransferase [Nakamurella lactea]
MTAPDGRPATVPAYRIAELTIDDGLDIAMWPTPGPWAIQDSLQAPRPDEGYWAIRGTGEAGLIGYCCFGAAARPPGFAGSQAVLDVAFGLSPALTGRHLATGVAAAVVAHGVTVAKDRRLRCAVASWNDAGRRAAEAAGFGATGVHEFRGGSGVTTYFVYER